MFGIYHRMPSRTSVKIRKCLERNALSEEKLKINGEKMLK